MNLQWSEKYRPKNLKEVVGNKDQIEKIKHFVSERKPVLIYGPVGSGKTSLAHVLADYFNFEILEVNASDFRDKDSMNRIVRESAEQRSLFSKGKIILIDEIDGISGNEDRGGISELLKILESPKAAFILTCTNPYDSKLSKLRRKCRLIELEISNSEIVGFLKEICKREKIICDEEILRKITRGSGNDLRAAINDLQCLVIGRDKIDFEDLDVLGERERLDSILNFLTLIFKSKDIKSILNSLENLDLDYDEVLLWIDENIPLEYNGEDLVRGYYNLSRADVFRGRIRRRQYWRFLVYIKFLLGIGIAFSKVEKGSRAVQYKRSSRILRMWIAKQKYMKRNLIAEKISEICHTSKRDAIKEILPYLAIMVKRKMNLDIGLDEEEISWLKKTL